MLDDHSLYCASWQREHSLALRELKPGGVSTCMGRANRSSTTNMFMGLMKRQPRKITRAKTRKRNAFLQDNNFIERSAHLLAKGRSGRLPSNDLLQLRPGNVFSLDDHFFIDSDRRGAREPCLFIFRRFIFVPWFRDNFYLYSFSVLQTGDNLTEMSSGLPSRFI